MKNWNVLSLFDGIGAARVSLERSNIGVNLYYASEIDKHACKVVSANYPDTIHLGDITKLDTSILEPIDIIMGGSPCTSFSSSGKREGFEGESKLFFDFLRVLREVKPKYFLFENVVMKKEWEDIITKELGVEPVHINSALVSAQSRPRTYWTNIGKISQPEDRGVLFVDISDDGWSCGAMRGRRINPATGKRYDKDKTFPIKQYIEFREDGKSNCLTTVQKDNVAVEMHGKHLRQELGDIEYRWLSATEYEKLQTFKVGYTSMISDNQRKKCLGNSWTIEVIVHILNHLPKDI